MAKDLADILLEIVKRAMKKGYLYGLGDDGHIYKVKADMPKAGETIVLPPMHMPKEYGEETDG